MLQKLKIVHYDRHHYPKNKIHYFKKKQYENKHNQINNKNNKKHRQIFNNFDIVKEYKR